MAAPKKSALRLRLTASKAAALLANKPLGASDQDLMLMRPEPGSLPRTKTSRVLTRTPSAEPSAPVMVSMPDPLQLMSVVEQHVALRPQVKRQLKAAFHALLVEQANHSRPTPAQAGQPAMVPHGDQVLSSQEAADLIGVSRPFLTARIDAGEIPLFTRVGNQRRVLASAVRAWQVKSREQRSIALRQLAQDIDDEYQDGAG